MATTLVKTEMPMHAELEQASKHVQLRHAFHTTLFMPYT